MKFVNLNHNDINVAAKDVLNHQIMVKVGRKYYCLFVHHNDMEIWNGGANLHSNYPKYGNGFHCVKFSKNQRSAIFKGCYSIDRKTIEKIPEIEEMQFLEYLHREWVN